MTGRDDDGRDETERRLGITVVGTVQREAWAARELPPVERLDAGLWSVPVPIPRNPLRYTLSYLIPADDGIVVVDPGWDTDEGWAALTRGLVSAGASFSDVTGIVATHVHGDHHGMSARLQERTGAWVGMHPAERDSLPQRTGLLRRVDVRASQTRWLRSAGASETDVVELCGVPVDDCEAHDLPDRRPMAEPDVLLHDGDALPVRGRTIRTVWTPGHTPGHICLLEPDAGVMLTGDHVLPRITPNIGLAPDLAGAPLALFLDSLERVAEYDQQLDGLTALPAHEYRFRGLAGRARTLQAHHAERCRELLDVVERLGAPTLWEVTKALTWSRPWAEVGPMRIGALAETGAHVRHLVDLGQLVWEGAVPAFNRSGDDEPSRVRLSEPARTTVA
ncbi:MAG: MBL fold metallo-hydrolase [Pseudonocardia sp.]|nr:MBL fold metallo-hydrolase [Pseudonocardia sp.]